MNRFKLEEMQLLRVWHLEIQMLEWNTKILFLCANCLCKWNSLLYCVDSCLHRQYVQGLWGRSLESKIYCSLQMQWRKCKGMDMKLYLEWTTHVFAAHTFKFMCMSKDFLDANPGVQDLTYTCTLYMYYHKQYYMQSLFYK